MNGKGSAPRPLAIAGPTFRRQYDATFGAHQPSRCPRCEGVACVTVSRPRQPTVTQCVTCAHEWRPRPPRPRGVQ